MLSALGGGAAWILNHWREAPRSAFWGAAATGIIIGICALFRSTSLPFLAAFLLMVPILIPFRKGLLLGLVCVVAGVLTISPWMARNKIVLGSFVLGQESTYLALLNGVGFNPNPIGMNGTDTVILSTVNMNIRVDQTKNLKQSYYSGGAGIYEAVSGERFTEYVAIFPNTFYRATLRNLWSNMTNFADLVYYNPIYVLTPQLSRLSGLLGINSLQIQKGWMAFAHFFPYRFVAGAGMDFIMKPRSLVNIIPLAMTAGQLSIAASHVTRYTFHIIEIYYLYASFLLVIPLVGFWRLCVSKRADV